MTTPVIKRVETATGHYYQRADGSYCPGVTTILNALPKEALINWKLRKAVTAALSGEKGLKNKPEATSPVDWLTAAGDREAGVAAKTGSKSHFFAEAHMLGQEPDVEALEKAERSQVDCYLQFVRDHQPKPILVEKVVTYIDPKTNQPLYCGTMDLVAELIDEQVWMIDYKGSSSKPRPSHALQAAFYTHASHWLDDDGTLQPMVPVDKAAVVLLNGGGAGHCYRWFELDISDVVFSVCKSLLRVHNFSRIEDRVILGALPNESI